MDSITGTSIRQTQEIAVAEPKTVKSGLFNGELSSIYFFNPLDNEWQWEGHGAPTFPTRYLCGLECYGTNLSTTTETLVMILFIYNPEGELLRERRYEHPNTAQWEGHYDYLRDFAFTPGDYVGKCDLYIGGELVDSITRVIAHVTGRPIEAVVSELWRWDDKENEWVSNAPQSVPIGDDIGMRVQARNICDDTIDVRADIRYTSEQSGDTKTIKGDVITIDPGDPPDYAHWDFLWEADEPYEWIADVIIYAGYPGQSLTETDRIEVLPVAWVVPEPTPEFEGTITEMTLRYDSNEKPIPVSDIPVNFYEGLVIIRGRNDTSENQKMGVHWIVKDPDGLVVPSGEYTRWENFWTGPGLEQAFIDQFGAFALDKEGSYTLLVELLMNPSDPVVVDTYSGVLCTVTTGVPPEYELIHETISHFAYIYDGEVEDVIATFKTDPFTPSAWAGEQFAKKLEEEYRARGGNVLEVRVYVDVTPLLWTDYRIELIGTPLGGEVEAARGIGVAGIPIAIAVLIIALAIIAVIVVATLMWERFQRSFEHKPGLEEVKPAWGKEALILDIQDAEVHWERPVTPPETLEGMSEEELRAYLDQIAEEEIPTEPEVPWGLIAIAGVLGLGAVGVGAALAARRKE